jgi:trans-aconitate methyltransferase
MEFLALAVALAAIVLVLGGTMRTGVPPMPTSSAVRACMFDLSKDLTPATVYELGAGWGGLATALARRWPEARVVAVEVSPLPWAVCRLRQALFGPANLEVRFADALRADLHSADLCVCFLCPPAMAKLAPRLRDALAPGAHVLSNAFALPGWAPLREARVADIHRTVVYLYRCEKS